MSHTEPSPATPPDKERPHVGKRSDVGGDDSTDKNTKCVGSGCGNVRERVIKEIGLTSSTFIGPAFPPKTTTNKSDIEDTLSEFYKELEKIDTPDGANGNPENQSEGFIQPLTHPHISTSKRTRDVSQEVNSRRSAETDRYQKGSGQKQSSWPHWYQNEPYYPRRPRPGMDPSSGRAAPIQNQWHHPQPMNRPPNPRLHRPPVHRPPPTSAFPNSQNQPPHVNPGYGGPGMAIQYHEESHFPTFSRFPSQNEYSRHTEGYAEDYHFDRDERRCSYNGYSEYENIGWSRDREEEWSQYDEDYDRCERFVSENELWEQQHHCRPPDHARAYHSSLVLILMRGLPGSGKTTLARELLSTGPSGLILSTDDYFAHKDGYRYDPGFLGVAHEWNQRRAKDAMHDGRSPIIIDNTNIQAWEMKPYVEMALERGYKVDFCEPHTSWKLDPYELEKRNKHGVPQEKIAQMLDRFSFPISIDTVMRSQEPLHVNQRRQPEPPQTVRTNPDFH